MHAGNVLSALVAWLVAKSQGGSIVLRIEDLDDQRSRQEHIDAIMADLERLGLTWDEGPLFQSQRTELYEEAMERLSDSLYPCFCSRADLHVRTAPHAGERFVYSGHCKGMPPHEVARLAHERAREGRVAALRLSVPDEEVSFVDIFQGRFSQNLARDVGDFIVRRSDGGFAYQLAVVVDDADMGVTSVVRGIDLISSTPQQIHLARLLDAPIPSYAHLPLLCAYDGRRLAKRNRDATVESLIEAHGTPEGAIGHIAFVAGLTESDDPISCQELLAIHDEDSLAQALGGGRIGIPFA